MLLITLMWIPSIDCSPSWATTRQGTCTKEAECNTSTAAARETTSAMAACQAPRAQGWGHRKSPYLNCKITWSTWKNSASAKNSAPASADCIFSNICIIWPWQYLRMSDVNTCTQILRADVTHGIRGNQELVGFQVAGSELNWTSQDDDKGLAFHSSSGGWKVCHRWQNPKYTV